MHTSLIMKITLLRISSAVLAIASLGFPWMTERTHDGYYPLYYLYPWGRIWGEVTDVRILRDPSLQSAVAYSALVLVVAAGILAALGRAHVSKRDRLLLVASGTMSTVAAAVFILVVVTDGPVAGGRVYLEPGVWAALASGFLALASVAAKRRVVQSSTLPDSV